MKIRNYFRWVYKGLQAITLDYGLKLVAPTPLVLIFWYFCEAILAAPEFSGPAWGGIVLQVMATIAPYLALTLFVMSMVLLGIIGRDYELNFEHNKYSYLNRKRRGLGLTDDI